jgi:hypothetical protein
MGKLLSSAIKMQGGGAVATASLTLQLVNAIEMSWTKNGVFQGYISGTQNFTLNAGDTFFASAFDDAGVTIDYYLNGTYITSYSAGSLVNTPTFTAVAGNTYGFYAYSGF